MKSTLLLFLQRVLDYEQYIGDLSQASEDESQPPVYSLLYTAK